LLQTNFGRNRIDFFNISGNSGNFNNFSVGSGMILPVSLTGTFLYVNNSGNLTSFGSRAYSILFSNANSWATGNTSYRWIDNQSTLVMGSTGVVSYDVLATSTNDTRYNILLSSNKDIDTVFNNLGLGNKFSVINSGQLNTRRGLHINPASGQVAINVIPDTYAGIASQSHLYVEGKTHTQSLRIGNNSISGLYLRVDNSGNVFSSLLDLKTQFSGLWPFSVTTTSLGGSDTFRVDLGLSNQDRSNFSMVGVSGDGRFLVFDSTKWDLSNSLKVPQSTWVTNNTGPVLRTLRGIEFGYRPKINYTYHSHVFASSSFLDSSSLYDGSSQFSQYYLRSRTVGNDIAELTTDWGKNSSNDVSQYNTISLKNTNGYDYDNVWNYKIFVSVIWQDGTTTQTVTGPKSAAGMTIEGCVFRSADGGIFTKLGKENINVYATGIGAVGMPAGMGIATYIDNDANQTLMPRLAIQATGVAGKTTLWSASAQINQLNHPAGSNLFGNT
jgi:hypothetical protein